MTTPLDQFTRFAKTRAAYDVALIAMAEASQAYDDRIEALQATLKDRQEAAQAAHDRAVADLETQYGPTCDQLETQWWAAEEAVAEAAADFTACDEILAMMGTVRPSLTGVDLTQAGIEQELRTDSRLTWYKLADTTRPIDGPIHAVVADDHGLLNKTLCGLQVWRKGGPVDHTCTTDMARVTCETCRQAHAAGKTITVDPTSTSNNRPVVASETTQTSKVDIPVVTPTTDPPITCDKAPPTKSDPIDRQAIVYDWITVNEAAALLKLSGSRILQLAKEGVLEVKGAPHKRRLISRTSVMTHLLAPAPRAKTPWIPDGWITVAECTKRLGQAKTTFYNPSYKPLRDASKKIDGVTMVPITAVEAFAKTRPGPVPKPTKKIAQPPTVKPATPAPKPAPPAEDDTPPKGVMCTLDGLSERWRMTTDNTVNALREGGLKMYPGNKILFSDVDHYERSGALKAFEEHQKLRHLSR